jgi:hypothetical protein
MNLTSNFDIAVELGIDSVKEIFHLAFKNESIFPHNIGPIPANVFGQNVQVFVTVLDDQTNPADLSFQDVNHILFTIPFQMAVQVPGAPDPSLSEINLKAVIAVPGLLNSWTDPTTNDPVLGIDFTGVTAGDIQVPTLTGVPTINITNIVAAIHTKYMALQHTYTLAGNTLNLYDDTSDPSLNPPNPYSGSASQIQGSQVTAGSIQYLEVVLPIWVNVPVPVLYTSPGHITFYRQMTQTATSITIDFSVEPTDPAYKTTVVLDVNIPVLTPTIEADLQPLAVQAIAGFGTQTQLVPNQADAVSAVQQQAAAYISQRKFGMYTPQSGQNQIQLSTPVGFLLVADGVLAILMNRRDSSVTDFPPDNFLAGNQLAMAVGQAKVQEMIQSAINTQFPQLNSGGAPINTPQGHGTLTSLSVVPEDSGGNGATPGHLWTTGNATVHIPCWFDSSVSFSGPIFIDTTLTETSSACVLTFQARAGHFNIGQSCCTVFEDLLVPIVGWIMLGVTQDLITSVGGSLASQIAQGQTGIIHPIPPVVTGIAQISACLTSLNIFSAGFVFPGTMSIVRVTTSFQDLQDQNRLPGSQ